MKRKRKRTRKPTLDQRISLLEAAMIKILEKVNIHDLSSPMTLVEDHKPNIIGFKQKLSS